MPPSPQEPGPDFSTFEGGAGAAGGIIGTSQLKTAIDKFAEAVDKLDSATAKMPSGGGGGSSGAAAPAGWPRLVNAGGATISPTAAGQPGPNAEGMGGGMGGGGGGSGVTTPGADNGSPGGNGGWGPPPGGGFSKAGVAGAIGAGLGGGGGMVGGLARTALSYAPAPVAAAVGGLASAGAAAQPSQLALNTLQYQSSIYGQDYNTTRLGAMGTAGSLMGGQQQVQWGLNPSDMAATYASLQQTTAQVNPFATGRGSLGASNVTGAMGAANIANPMASGATNAAAVANLYNPQTSLNMMMMGMRNTPDQAGTGAHTPITNTFNELLNRIGGGKKMTQQQLFAQLAPGQKGNVSLQNLTGGNQQMIGQYNNMLGIQNALETGQNGQKSMSASQVNSVFGQLQSGSTNTFNQGEATLKQYGISQSAGQMLKSKAGNQAQSISDTSSGFIKGLKDSTKLLSDFETVLHKVINSVHGGGLVGFGEGLISNILGGGAAMPASRSGDSGSTTSALSKAMAQSSTPPAKVDRAVQLAKTQVGVPYAYGREAPGVGFDCSALPQWAYKAAGVTLPRTAVDQLRYLQGRLVSPQAAREGDLVFQPGAGNQAHEAMLVDNGRNIVEARGTGQPISIRKYNPGEWPKAARPYKANGPGPSAHDSKGTGKTNVKGGGGGHGSGAQVAAYAATFATGKNHPYVWGGASPNGWDCSGFAADVYEHFGYVPGNGHERWGNTTTQFADKKYLQSSGPVVGALVYEAGSDGTVAKPGHVGIMTGPGKMAAAADPAQGTIIEVPQGVSGYRIPKGGFNGTGGAAPAGSSPTSSGSSTTTSASAGGAGPGGMGAGLGDSTSEGSTSELSAFMGSIVAGGLGGAGTMTRTTTTGTPATGAAPNGGAPAGNGQTGTIALAKYLITAGYSKPAAAAAAAVANGEGGGNPESYEGNGGANLAQAKAWKAGHWSTPGIGAGLIGWTPASSMAAHGGTYGTTVAADMASQEKAMVSWMKTFGWPPPQSGFPNSAAGALKAAFSASAAYERPAVAGSDVKAGEVTSVFNALATGGDIQGGGMAWVGERGPELISVSQDSTVHDAASSIRLASQSMAQSAQGPWSASGTSGQGYQYSTSHPLYSGGKSAGGNSNGVQVTFASGAVVINGPTSAASMSTTGNSGAAAAQTFTKQLQSELARINMACAIGSGVSS